jgi:hypothetical protein
VRGHSQLNDDECFTHQFTEWAASHFFTATISTQSDVMDTRRNCDQIAATS